MKDDTEDSTDDTRRGTAAILYQSVLDLETPYRSRDHCNQRLLAERWVVVLAVVTVTAVALLLRLGMIDRYPIHGDEAIYINQIRDFHDAGQVTYVPFAHGISVYYVTHFGYPTQVLFDSTLLWARWIVALSWLLVLPLVVLLRREAGDVAVIIAVTILGTHLFGVRSSVLFRHDSILAALLVLNVVLYLRYVRTRSRTVAVLLGSSAGLSIATTEHAYVLAPVLIAPIIGLIGYDWASSGRHDGSGTTEVRGSLREIVDCYLPLSAIVPLLLSLFTTLALLFAEWPLTPRGFVMFPMTMYEGIEFGIKYGGNNGQPSPIYYLNYLVQTPLILSLGLVGLAGTVLRSRLSLVRAIFTSWFTLGIFIFGFVLSRQRPYYVIYLLTPLAILAGFGVQDLLILAAKHRSRTFSSGRIVILVTAVAVVLALTGSGVGYTAVGIDGPEADYVGGYYWQEADFFADIGEIPAAMHCERVGWIGSDMPIKSIPQYHLYPATVNVLGETDTQKHPSNLDKWPSVLVSNESVKTWNTSRTTVIRSGDWYVYAPRGGCT
jgi:uncharacterized protein (TIGR03663 family)